jgi:microcystin-dependent protein
MSTSNYSFNTPTVGGSEDTWGTQLNDNWTALDTLLGGVSQTEFAKLDGLTASTAELNLLTGQTSLVPAGVIVMWSGSIASIPVGWLLCDGTNGTPNLRDRFVVGAGSTYAVNATGGANTVTLTTAQIPSHTHTATVNDPGHSHNILLGGSSGGDLNTGGASIPLATSTTAISPSGTNISVSIGSTGGGGSHENRPPYFALAFIMKS